MKNVIAIDKDELLLTDIYVIGQGVDEFPDSGRKHNLISTCSDSLIKTITSTSNLCPGHSCLVIDDASWLYATDSLPSKEIQR